MQFHSEDVSRRLVSDFGELGSTERAEVSRAVTRGDCHEAGKQWAAGLLHTAKHPGYEPLRGELVRWRAGPGELEPESAVPQAAGMPEAAEGPKPEKADEKKAERIAEADRLLDYAATRKQLLHYDKFLADGWRISCSPTESDCGAVP